MKRKITSEERSILLKNPELVMFDPYNALKTHRCSLGRALVLPALVALAIALWALLFPDFIDAHPAVFAGVGCVALIAASGSLPVLYLLLDSRNFRKAEQEHYAEQLELLLPRDLECQLAHVQWVTREKAEGGWVLDGREEMFGYASFVNCFAIEPDTDLAVIGDGGAFWAFVKRDAKTESLYRSA